MPLSEEVEVLVTVTRLAVAGGLVTHPIQIHLVQTQVQILLVAGTAEALTVEVPLMIGNVSIKFKEMSKFRYEK